MWHTVVLAPTTFSFTLPSHKTDHFYHGSTPLGGMSLPTGPTITHVIISFNQYLTQCDLHFPFHPQLWLHMNGHMATYLWAVEQIKLTLADDIGGHSMRSGGTTALALTDIPNDHIQACSHWVIRCLSLLHQTASHHVIGPPT